MYNFDKYYTFLSGGIYGSKPYKKRIYGKIYFRYCKGLFLDMFTYAIGERSQK